MYYPVFEKYNQRRPILKFSDIENIVFNVIFDYDSTYLVNPKPINVDMFIESYLGCIIDYQYLSNNGIYLGMILFNNSNVVAVFDKNINTKKYITAKKGTIFIDNDVVLNENRYRFTCAHECGHWILHRQFYEINDNQISIFDSQTSEIKCRSTCNNYLNQNNFKNDDDWIEWQADKFASGLLMPTKAVINLLSNVRRDENYMVEKVSDLFNVSKQAAYYRLCDLKIISDSNQIKI